jgi:hypothetical protein
MQAQEIALSRGNDPRTFQRIGVKDWSGDTNMLKVRRGGVGGYRDEAPWLDEMPLPRTDAVLARLADHAPQRPASIRSTSSREG